MAFPFSFWGAFTPKSLPGLAAWYDVSVPSSMVIDSANRVSLVSDRSGNSAVNVFASGGAASNTATSPNVSVTGSRTFSFDVMLPDYTPSGNITIVDKLSGVNGFQIILLTTGVIRFVCGNGTNTANVDSTTGLTLTDLNRGQFQVIWTDGVGASFTQNGAALGSAVAAARTLTNAAVSITIGTLTNGVIYSFTINGVYTFNPSGAAKLATSFVAPTTGETWTINTSGATGARISGERDLYQGTVANQPTYLPFSGSKYAYLSGASGVYLSAPDSAAISFTSDLDVAADLAAVDYTPSANQVLVAKGTSVVPANLEYALQLNTAGTLTLYWSTGAATLSATSSVAVPFADRARGSVRATLDADNGAAGNTVTFYTATTFGTWTQLGTTVVQGGATSIQNSTNALAIGSFTGGSSGLATVNVYRATLTGTISSTLAFDFNADSYTTGSTLVDQSANAATITINGGATIVTAPALYFDGSNDYLKAPPFALSQPETVQFVGRQVTWENGGWFYDGSTTVNSMALIQIGTTPELRISAGSSVASNTGLAIKTNANISSVFNGSSSSLRINKNTATTGDALTNAGNGIVVADRATLGGFNPNITANEIAIYNTAQSTAQLDQFANYAGSKWGFTV